MAELISLLASLISLVNPRPKSSPFTSFRLSRSDLHYAQDRWGGGGSSPLRARLFALVVDVKELRKIEEHVLAGGDEGVMAFKDSHLGGVGMTAVASAIIAQVGMTTLQLNGLDQVHWTAAAFVIASLLFGVLSVVLSCLSQQILGMLNEPSRVRLWLSNGHFTSDSEGGRKKRLQASISALQLTRLPNAFLGYGVTCFLTGLGLYLGFAYRQDLDTTPGRNNNEAVLILFLVTASCAILTGAGWSALKLLEVTYAEEAWETDRQGRLRYVSDAEGEGLPRDHSTETTSLLDRRQGSRSDMDGLAEALEKAAKAHRECAEADREVASLMRKC